jgi:hypothetical protein
MITLAEKPFSARCDWIYYHAKRMKRLSDLNNKELYIRTGVA